MGARSSQEIVDEIARDAIKEWGVDTIGQVLSKAERASSSSDPDSMKRCSNPSCRSVRILKKLNRRDMPQRKDGDFKCWGCNWHGDADELLAPLDERPLEQALKWLDKQQRYRKIHRNTMPINTPFHWLSRTDLEEPAERRPLLSELDDKQLTEIAIRAYGPWTDGGPSYREIAAVLPYSRQWVGERIREWKRGGHRDLVERPGPTADATGGEPIAADGGTSTSRWAAYGGD